MATFARSSSLRTITRRRTAAETIDMMEGEDAGGSTAETRRDESREPVDLDTYIDGTCCP